MPLTFSKYYLYADAVAGRNLAILATAVVVWAVLMLAYLVREVKPGATRLCNAAIVAFFYFSLLGLAGQYLRWLAGT